MIVVIISYKYIVTEKSIKLEKGWDTYENKKIGVTIKVPTGTSVSREKFEIWPPSEKTFFFSQGIIQRIILDTPVFYGYDNVLFDYTRSRIDNVPEIGYFEHKKTEVIDIVCRKIEQSHLEKPRCKEGQENLLYKTSLYKEYIYPIELYDNGAYILFFEPDSSEAKKDYNFYLIILRNNEKAVTIFFKIHDIRENMLPEEKKDMFSKVVNEYILDIK